MLSEKTLQWLRDHLTLGDRRIFDDMESTSRRVKRETEKSRPLKPETFAQIVVIAFFVCFFADYGMRYYRAYQ